MRVDIFCCGHAARILSVPKVGAGLLTVELAHKVGPLNIVDDKPGCTTC